MFAEFSHAVGEDHGDSLPIHGMDGRADQHCSGIHAASRAINTFLELHNIPHVAKDNAYLKATRRVLMLRHRPDEAAAIRLALPVDVAYSFLEHAEQPPSAPRLGDCNFDFRACSAPVVNYMLFHHDGGRRINLETGWLTNQRRIMRQRERSRAVIKLRAPRTTHARKASC